MENNDRKFSLIDKKVNAWLQNEKTKNKGLCLNRFRADFEVEDLHKYSVGDIVVIDGNKYKITIKNKACYTNECDLFNEKNEPCLLKNSVAFATDIW